MMIEKKRQVILCAMVRPLRLEFPGALSHVTSRSSGTLARLCHVAHAYKYTAIASVYVPGWARCKRSRNISRVCYSTVSRAERQQADNLRQDVQDMTRFRGGH